MLKPIGPQLLIRIKKQKSSIELLPGTDLKGPEVQAIVEEVGTKCSLGIKAGHEVMFKAGTSPIVIEETEDYDLLLIQEMQVAYVKNWTKEDEAGQKKATGCKAGGCSNGVSVER